MKKQRHENKKSNENAKKWNTKLRRDWHRKNTYRQKQTNGN
jgi:hypothetical protein